MFTAPGPFYGTVQVATPWHMMKVPVTGLTGPVQLESPVKLHVPTATPPLSVPVVVVVPFDVPVSPFW